MYLADVKDFYLGLFQKEWDLSQKGRHLYVVKSTVKPWSHAGGNDPWLVILSQLRMGWDALARTEFRKDNVKSPECPCGAPVEDRDHFLISCPCYADQRQQLRDSLPLSVDSSSVVDLLGGGNYSLDVQLTISKLVCEFVKNSGRFVLGSRWQFS